MPSSRMGGWKLDWLSVAYGPFRTVLRECGWQAFAERLANVVRSVAWRKRRTLFAGMGEVAIAATSFLKKRYSGKRGPRFTVALPFS